MFPEYANPLFYLIKRYGLSVLYCFLLVCFLYLFKKWGLKSLLLALVAFYGLLLFLAGIGQKFIIYYPDREVQATPAELELPYYDSMVGTCISTIVVQKIIQTVAIGQNQKTRERI